MWSRMTLNYVPGEQLGQYSGRVKSPAMLWGMQDGFSEFTVRVIEVCTGSGWNRMIIGLPPGDGRKSKPPLRRKTVEDIYG